MQRQDTAIISLKRELKILKEQVSAGPVSSGGGSTYAPGSSGRGESPNPYSGLSARTNPSGATTVVLGGCPRDSDQAIVEADARSATQADALYIADLRAPGRFSSTCKLRFINNSITWGFLIPIPGQEFKFWFSIDKMRFEQSVARRTSAGMRALG